MPEEPMQPLAGQGEMRLPLDRVRGQPSCERCGYNLHTQQIVREQETAIAVVRCPECGLVRPVSCLSYASCRWPHLPRAARSRQPFLPILVLVLCAATAYYLYERAPRMPAPGGNPLGFVGICGNWALASVPLMVTLLLAAGQLYRATWITRMVALAAAVLLGYVGHRNWVAAGGPLRPARPDVAIAVVCHVVLAAALGAACRPALRAMIRAICPPAARGVFECFWEVDGLAVPIKNP